MLSFLWFLTNGPDPWSPENPKIVTRALEDDQQYIYKVIDHTTPWANLAELTKSSWDADGCIPFCLWCGSFLFLGFSV